eukprot:NODE_3439_length_2035_cov_8.568134.p1 GENE.NODE_3439_length_2035_cov_8.568134~~NODE_3439_length_2035_cov_8.568134.p1  ORF type:complete len:604 (+),score=83.60 NODE_3439_length_2035_cov_8.568134:226-1812(+)
MAACPWLLTVKVRNTCYFCYMLFCTFSISAYSLDGDSYMDADKRLFIIRFGLQLVHQRPLQTAVWNMAYAISATHRITNEDAHGCSVLMGSSHLALQCRDAILMTTIVWAAWKVHKAAVASAQHELSAAGALLHTMCDAVIELDEGLRITQHAPALAMMLMHAQPSSLKDTNLRSLLFSEEDVLGLERSLTGASESRIANACHLRMRDSFCNSLRVELFHVSFTGQGKQSCHLVGIREYADSGSLVRHVDGATISVPVGGAVGAENDVVSSHDSSTSSTLGSGVISLQIDATSLEVMACSPSLCTFLGHSPLGACFDGWLWGRDKTKFLRKYYDAVNEYLNADDGQDMAYVINAGRVKLMCPLQVPQMVLPLKASCRYWIDSLSSDVGDDSSSDALVAHIELTNLQMRRPVFYDGPVQSGSSNAVDGSAGCSDGRGRVGRATRSARAADGGLGGSGDGMVHAGSDDCFDVARAASQDRTGGGEEWCGGGGSSGGSGGGSGGGDGTAPVPTMFGHGGECGVAIRGRGQW